MHPPVLTITPLLNASQRRQFQQLAAQMAAIILTDTEKKEREPVDPHQPHPITIKLTHKAITT